MYHYYTDDQNSCKKPAIAQNIIQTPMKATIICLPPILHTCENVPAADRAGGATAAIIKPTSIDNKTSYNNNNKNNYNYYNTNKYSINISCCSGYSDSVDSTTTIRGGSCCHRWEHKNYDYERHKPRTSTTTTIIKTRQASMTTTPTTQQHNQQKGQENDEEERQNEANNNNAIRSRNVSISNSGIIRERRRNFYNLKEKITTLTLSPTSSPSLFSSSSTLTSSSWRCRTIALEQEKIAESTSKALANRIRRPTSLNSPSSTSSSFWPIETAQCDFQINCIEKMSYNQTTANDRGSNENIHLVDSYTLESKQLVIPIVTEIKRSSSSCRHSNSFEHVNKKTNSNYEPTERKTQTLYCPLAKEIIQQTVHNLEMKDWRTTTAASLTYTSANVSQTTKKQNAFFDECELLSSRAKNTRTTTTIAGDIITHDEVENFKCCNDVNGLTKAKVKSEGYVDRICSTSSIKELQKQHPVSVTMNPAQQSKSLLPQSSYNVERQRQLWQQMSLAWVTELLHKQRQRHQVVKMFTTTTMKFLLSTLMLLMLITTANCWAGRQDVPTNCSFPLRWEGSWFLSGYQQSIHIKGSQISYRGRCVASDGNKYLIVDEKGCHRCLVIYEKHENVLQYKESECEGDSMYMHQSNPSAMAMRSVLKQNGGEHRGGAHSNTNGHSRLSSSDQYIMRSNDDMNDYFCKGRETLQNLCDQIPGDALLYSLFRENAEPVKCPLKGPFIFTYNRGHGECKSPVSNIESCTEDSRLLLSFQACPDVQGTESTVEELTCLAAWKDGNSRYLVGLVSHHHAISNEERYRCFVYEKISTLMGGPSMISSKDAEYKLAQSGDATCNGLDSAEVGSRIMTLRKPPVAERCDFPVWFKGPRHWHALMGNAVYNYHTNDGSVHIIKSNGYMETRALCEQINKQTSTEMMAVVHYTTGCQSGFMCMLFYRRDTHVIEIQTGKQASRLEDACAPDHFDVHKMPYITLLASNPDPHICPMEGLYNLRGAIGPPYLTTRHKRNHNNKVHNPHGHHHFSDGFSSTLSGSGSNGGSGGVENAAGAAADDIYGRKRRGSLSFRNSDRIEKFSWHANTRGLPIRSRRDAVTKSTSANLTAYGVIKQTNDTTSNVYRKELSMRALHTKIEIDENTKPSVIPTTPTIIKITTNITATTTMSTKFASTTDIAIVRQRNRRNVPGCITNFKAQRQLWLGCSEPNVIDVRPLCNDEGDEEYYCHGSWAENTTVYIIARHKRTKHGVCISYRPTEGSSAKLVIGDACYRGTDKPPEHHLVANLSVYGKCGETGAASTKIHLFSYWIILAVSVFSTFYNGSWSNLYFSTSFACFTNIR